MPKNEALSKYLISFAEKQAKNDAELTEIEFYKVYITKLKAARDNSTKDFDDSNEKLYKLAFEKNHAASMHLMAKECYKSGLNMISGKYRKRREEMMNLSFGLFMQGIEQGFFHSYYYAGEMLEKGDSPDGVNLKQAVEFYKAAASYDEPRAMFKLSAFHAKGMIVRKDLGMEIYYMKKAATLGLVDAQHNYGVMLMTEKYFDPPDFKKSIAWFVKAAGRGYRESRFNAAKMMITGSPDGKVKANRKVALIWLRALQAEKNDVKVVKLIEDAEKPQNQVIPI
jgi:TPR repeat protein